MATINPFQGPINYSVDVQSPFEVALGGIKLGASVADIQTSQKKRELEAEALQKAKTAQTELQTLFQNPNATSADYARVTAFLPKDQAESVRRSFEMMNNEQQQARLSQSGQIFTALKSGQVDIAKNLLQNQADAFRNSGREEEASAAETYLQLIDLNPIGAQTTIGLMMAQLPGGKEYLENVDKTLATMRAETLAPEVLREQKAKSDKAVQEAKNAVDTAGDDVAKAAATRKFEEEKANQAKIQTEIDDATQAAAQAKIIADSDKARSDADKAVAEKEKAVLEAAGTPARLKAEQELRDAQATKAAIEAKYEERKQVDEIVKRAGDLGLTKAQKNKLLVETANLNLTGKLLKLDFDAALKGVPLPSKNTGTNVGNATEDERKAAGWLVQADNAYKNMLNAMYTKDGKKTGAQEVGFFEAVGLGKVSQSPERQKFNQASASLAEALLRAATGAGQNEAEVKQKIEELTPTYFDTQENINQKLAAIPVYLDSLKARAGRAAPTEYKVPTKETVIEAKPFGVTVGGQTFNFPSQQALDTFKNSDLYKKAAGNK